VWLVAHKTLVVVVVRVKLVKMAHLIVLAVRVVLVLHLQLQAHQ
jgi:hypothetical protein